MKQDIQSTLFIQSWLKLSKLAKNSFRKFVRSPYFNINDHLQLTLEWVESVSLSKLQEFTKRDLHQFLFPKKTYDDKQIRYLFSDLLQLLKQFLVIEYQKKNHLQNQFDLVKTSRDQKLDKLYEKRVESI